MATWCSFGTISHVTGDSGCGYFSLAQPALSANGDACIMNIALRIYILVFVIFLYAPTFLLPLFAFNDSSIIAFHCQLYAGVFSALWQENGLQSAAVNSLIIATASSILATTLAMLASSASVRHDFPGKAPMMGIIMVPMFLPEIIIVSRF